jgi:peptidoglycan glycosyltransferase
VPIQRRVSPPARAPLLRPGRIRPEALRRRRWLLGAIPVLLVAAGGFALGIYEAGSSGRQERVIVQRYVRAWEHDDFAAMYALLDQSSRRRLSEAALGAELSQAAETATARALIPGHPGSRHDNLFRVPFRIDTSTFGTLREVLEVPVRGSGGGLRIHFETQLTFPGLRAGERLVRHSVLGPRGTILADDGTPLAAGPQRTSPIPAVAGEIVGTLGSIPSEDRALYAARGYPPKAKIGLDGLERIFQRRLAGRIGGTLMAGRRVLASASPLAGRTVRTTIDPAIEQATISALAGSYAGMTVMDPRTGAVLAAAGIAFSAVQPPGSTMKIVTSAGLLEAGLARLGTVYPYATEADLEGYALKNAGGESCGGTLLHAFAVSCNSVFAPLGAELGGRRLVAAAERFGFNQPPPFPGALESTIPSAAEIGGALAVGSSAIGQGKVQASTLEMADVGATIAEAGRRPIPTLLYGARPRFVQATTPLVAHQVEQMMIAVVQSGTGTAAQIPGVQVAGKTGTAELANTGNQTNATSETDGWFVGYAPVGAPRVVACALFPNAGYGASAAAPPVRQVLEAALAARH